MSRGGDTHGRTSGTKPDLPGVVLLRGWQRSRGPPLRSAHPDSFLVLLQLPGFGLLVFFHLLSGACFLFPAEGEVRVRRNDTPGPFLFEKWIQSHASGRCRVESSFPCYRFVRKFRYFSYLYWYFA